MHDSLRSDGVNATPSEQYDSNDTNTASHPWLQLQTITSFVQMKSSSTTHLEERTSHIESVSEDSNSSKSPHSNSDESDDSAEVAETSEVYCQKRKFKRHSESHSDPSHDRQSSRHSSTSNVVEQGSGDHIHERQDFSLRHKGGSCENINQRQPERQYSASIDERVSHITNSNNINYGLNNLKAVRPINNRLSSSLLIESLIDQLCKIMTSEKKQQQALYKIICNKLYDMRLIDGTYALDELQIVRNHYQKALYQMLSVAKSATQASHQRNVLLPLPSVKMEVPLGHNIMEVSRYKDEFEELKFLAKGGFGKVYCVRHRLDGAVYAVKKILFRNNDHILQSVREVKMLANLNHPNVVSYKAAWIEPVEYKDYESSSTSTPSTGTATDTNSSSNSNVKLQRRSVHEGDGQESEDIIFAESSDEGKEDSVKGRAKRTRITVEVVEEKVTKCTLTTVSFGTAAIFQNSHVGSKSKASPSVSHAVLPYRSSTPSKEYRGKRVGLAILYVQMQLCELTLRQWLDGRNNSTRDVPSIIPAGLNLFKQIVQGVEYIHNQKIIHHDIKPSNIFLSNDLSLVQVGDFGLSCWFRPQLKHGCNIGTPQYAAPEQLKGECDPKSDIFSLGIILVEILVPFHTVMERADIMNNLRKGKLPSELEAAAPTVAALVKRLIDPVARLRPKASALLEDLQNVERLKSSDQWLDEKDQLINEISAKYKAVIESKDREIFELKRRLTELERSASKDEEEANILQ